MREIYSFRRSFLAPKTFICFFRLHKESFFPLTQRHTVVRASETDSASEYYYIFIRLQREKWSAGGDDGRRTLVVVVSEGLFKSDPTQ